MDFHVTDMSAADLVRGLVTYPVIAPPHQAFFYNNDVYALGGYLPLLASGVALQDLGLAYAEAMHDRVFRPAGMTRARMSTDPRMVYDDYATPYGFDLRTTPTAMAFGSNGGAAPAGQAVASITDMAAWVRLQLRQGVSTSGERVASAANLAQCWTPEWSQTVPLGTAGDVTATGYGLGFSRTDYRDGTQVVWHNGALDGFTTYAGFLPQHDLGLVVLTNMNLYPSGAGLWTYVLNLLLDQRLGLNPGAANQALADSDRELATLAALGRRTVTVDLKRVEPFLGYYEKGWSLVRDRGTLQLLIGPRRLPLAAMPDGGFVVTEGLVPGTRVNLAVESGGGRHVEIVDFETVRQVNGAS
jgi:CubicO group peptidase (beta-lactamase class C family)